jgi:hypothetical protein
MTSSAVGTLDWLREKIPLAAVLHRHSNLMSITILNYNRKTDRHQFEREDWTISAAPILAEG